MRTTPPRERGGGIYTDDSIINLTNTKIIGNSAGVTYDAGTKTLSHIVTANGGNSGREGGGFWASGQANITMTGGEISNNIAWNSGGFDLRNDVKATLDGVKIDGNVGNNGGGFRAINDSELNIVNGSVISNNLATTDQGGGFVVHNNSQVTINDSTIDSNTATTRGGGGSIWADNNSQTATLFLNNSTVSNNVVNTQSGGGINVRHGASWRRIR